MKCRGAERHSGPVLDGSTMPANWTRRAVLELGILSAMGGAGCRAFARPTLISMVVAILLVPACVPRTAVRPPDRTQDVDTSAVVRAALTAFSTPNGPIIEVVAMQCDSPCRNQATDAVLAAYAAQHDATIVSRSARLPACRWNHQAPEPRKGLRLAVNAPSVQDGVVSVTVLAICRSEEGGRLDSFVEATTYQAELMDGS